MLAGRGRKRSRVTACRPLTTSRRRRTMSSLSRHQFHLRRANMGVSELRRFPIPSRQDRDPRPKDVLCRPTRVRRLSKCSRARLKIMCDRLPKAQTPLRQINFQEFRPLDSTCGFYHPTAGGVKTCAADPRRREPIPSRDCLPLSQPRGTAKAVGKRRPVFVCALRSGKTHALGASPDTPVPDLDREDRRITQKACASACHKKLASTSRCDEGSAPDPDIIMFAKLDKRRPVLHAPRHRHLDSLLAHQLAPSRPPLLEGEWTPIQLLRGLLASCAASAKRMCSCSTVQPEGAEIKAFCRITATSS